MHVLVELWHDSLHSQLVSVCIHQCLHHVIGLLVQGVVPVEGLDLSHVEPGLYDVHCLPLKLGGSDGAPGRCILLS